MGTDISIAAKLNRPCPNASDCALGLNESCSRTFPELGYKWEVVDHQELGISRQTLTGPFGMSLYINSDSVMGTFCWHWQRFEDEDYDTGRRFLAATMEFFAVDKVILIPGDIDPYVSFRTDLLLEEIDFLTFEARLRDHQPPANQFSDTMVTRKTGRWFGGVIEVTGWYVVPISKSIGPTIESIQL